MGIMNVPICNAKRIAKTFATCQKERTTASTRGWPMKIAVLALGSLAADPALRCDGPLVPLQLAWIDPPGRLTLALCDRAWLPQVRTPGWVSTLDDLDRARRELAEQEGVPIA